MSKDDVWPNLIGAIVAIALTFGIVGAIVTYEGYITTYLWRWFVIPVFHIRQISLVEAVGLSVFVSLLFGHVPPKDDRSGWTALGLSVIRITVLWLVGAIVFYGFM